MSQGNAFFDNMIEQLGMLSGLEFEAFVFAIADKMIPGYSGGVWTTQHLPNGTVALVVPESSAYMKDGKLRLVGMMNHCDVWTDPRSAGVAISILAVNWYWHRLADKGVCTQAQHSFFQRLYDRLRDGAFSDKNNTLDTSAIFSFID